MADLGDGDLSLQRHHDEQWHYDEEEGASQSPRMQFDPQELTGIPLRGATSPGEFTHVRSQETQEDGHDIGEAMILPLVEQVEPREHEDSRSEEAHIQKKEEEEEKEGETVYEKDRPGPVAASSYHFTTIEAREINDEVEDVAPTTSNVSSAVTEPVEEPPVYQHASPSAEPKMSEFSHQQITQQQDNNESDESDDGDVWQEMPVYAPFDIYDDNGKLVAREHEEEGGTSLGYQTVSGAGGGKGYTKVMVDEDAKSQTSMDEHTAYLFDKRIKEQEEDDDIEPKDASAQMNETKNLLTDNQRIAYVGVVRLAIAEMATAVEKMERTRNAKKEIAFAQEAMQLWSQKIMLRLYGHMELDSAEQLMIEQLADHGLQPGDLTPSLMQNARVKNPILEEDAPKTPSMGSRKTSEAFPTGAVTDSSQAPPPYQEQDGADMPDVRTPSQLPKTEQLDIDLRWTVLCDLFLLLISDSTYDSRSRTLLERVGAFLDVPWLDICRFEKRVTDALEMQDTELKEDLTETEHMASRRTRLRKRKMVMMGLATVGGGLVIGLSAGLLAPVIGAGLVAGLTTVGISSGGTFLAGAGGAALIGTTGVLSGGFTGARAAARRMGSVKTFEYRPLFNNRRPNLIITLAGWMTGKVDDVRLPYSTVDPIMGDIVSVLWEPEMLRSMGDTINILATEALTQGLQQILGSTILISLMAALQLPVVLTKLAYLIDNPWSVSMARADAAGLIMADSLIDRNLGARPITLVGFSLGSRVIFSCLRELARKGAIGIIQNVYIFGSPVVVNKDEWLKAKTVVAGRFVNGYATHDWILGYLFRATAGGIMRVAGLAKVEISGIENVDVTEFVPGHMSYRKAMPRCLREVGWTVDSDEFTEIEDPDPENHDKRQRELINEIEEARKELQKKPAKRRFGFWKSNKKTDKKEWETYEEQARTPNGEPSASAYANTEPGGVLFDIEAIRREAIELAAQGCEVRELKSTQPPIRVVSASALQNSGQESSQPPASPNKKNRMSLLRDTRSYESMPPAEASYRNNNAVSSRSLDYQEYDEHDHQGAGNEDGIALSFDPPERSFTSPLPSQPSQRAAEISRKLSSKWEQADLAIRPGPLSPSVATSRHDEYDGDLGNHNHWADEEDEFGQEKEVSMTFE